MKALLVLSILMLLGFQQAFAATTSAKVQPAQAAKAPAAGAVVAKPAKAPKPQPVVAPEKDEFQRALASEIKKQPGKSWFSSVIDSDFDAAIFGWDDFKTKVPAAQKPTAHLAYIYSLYRRGLNQSFVEELSGANGNLAWVGAPLAKSFADIVAPQLDNLLLDSGVIASSEIEKHLAKDSKIPANILLSLRAWGALRSTAQSQAIAEKLSGKSRLERLVLKSAFAGYLRAGQYPQAEKTLRKGTAFYLDAGRLKFQQGDYSAAVANYEKIPMGSVDFIPSREELAWAYLQKGDMGGLRGLALHLVHLGNRNEFPEVFVLKAISELKVCKYKEVEDEIQDFQKSIRPVALQLDQIFKTQNLPVPNVKDVYYDRAVATISTMELEKDFWKKKDYKEVVAKMDSYLKQGQQTEREEKSRYWKNKKAILSEAMLKMRFLKMEHLAQMRRLELLETKPWLGSNSKEKQVQLADLGYKTSLEVLRTAEKEKMVFPVDGAPWSDEMFKVRSLSDSECSKFQKAQGVRQ